MEPRASSMVRNFYPRPPRGGRRRHQNSCRQGRYFYPRPPRGGRLLIKNYIKLTSEISIHALREEGDAHIRDTRARNRISIHALREEGDSS